MLAPDDPRTKAIVLHRAFGLRACEAFAAFLADPPEPAAGDGRGDELSAEDLLESLKTDVRMAVAALEFFSRHLGLLLEPGELAVAGDLERQLRDLAPTLDEDDEDDGYWPAKVGTWWLRQAVLCLELCRGDDDSPPGTLGLIAHLLDRAAVAIQSAIPGGAELGNELEVFIRRRTGLDRAPARDSGPAAVTWTVTRA